MQISRITVLYRSSNKVVSGYKVYNTDTLLTYLDKFEHMSDVVISRNFIKASRLGSELQENCNYFINKVLEDNFAGLREFHINQNSLVPLKKTTKRFFLCMQVAWNRLFQI